MNPVTIRGVRYISQAAAGRALGTSSNNVYLALKRGRPDSVGGGRHNNYRKAIEFDGVTYNSRKELATFLKISDTSLFRKLRAWNKVSHEISMVAFFRKAPISP